MLIPFCGFKAISTTDLSHSKLIHHFVGMGFPEELVAKAIEENGNCTVTLPVLFECEDNVNDYWKNVQEGEIQNLYSKLCLHIQ